MARITRRRFLQYSGAGMAGILAAIKLREAGIGDFTVYEKADRIGGTWRENTYPGIACDVPSHLYSYSFAPNPNWSRQFSPGAEIQAYFEGVARRYELEPTIRFGEEVTRCAFEDGRWRIATSKGTRDAADFVIAALRQAGADLQAAVLGQSLISDPVDKTVTYFLVYLILGAMAARTKARFPQGAYLLPFPDGADEPEHDAP